MRQQTEYIYILLIENVSWSSHETCALGTINTKHRWGCVGKAEARKQWEKEGAIVACCP